ncbi:hypothetical protein N7510_006271 [Penicillium lagena]|uniref:uncharacterized protein n=1 Tax=Penicillium lagena TaxID=94218 RepID=UPI00253F6EE5|nr:uncharacterized protein N7510_006271 [Penicillium lagena]KAJ5613077.1 hypothetical protein N7510_006271 [Penicillium lagena]
MALRTLIFKVLEEAKHIKLVNAKVYNTTLFRGKMTVVIFNKRYYPNNIIDQHIKFFTTGRSSSNNNNGTTNDNDKDKDENISVD